MRTFPAHELGTRHFYAAGVLLFDRNGRLLCAPYSREHWRRRDGETVIGLGGIGGAMELGERPHETARREAREEIGQPVRLRSSRVTFVADRASRLRPVRYAERPAPLLLIRMPSDRRPYRPGYPSCDRWYYVWYVARVSGRLSCDLDEEVEALLWLPLDALERNRPDISSKDITALGGAIECGRLPNRSRLLPSGEFGLVWKLARRGALAVPHTSGP